MPLPVAPPFTGAVGLTSLGGGSFAAEIGDRWAVGPKAHGGILMVLLGKAAVAAAGEDAGLEPLAVSADFLRAPGVGTVELHTEVVKAGRTATVVAVRMLQDGQLMLTASVTAGRLPDEEPRHAELPDQAAEPLPEAPSPRGPETPGLGGACEVTWDPATVPFVRKETGAPVIRGWARPRDEAPDVWFALLAGDVLPPVVFNLGGQVGWAPTVQMTALLRAHPAPGWLRVESRARVVAGTWFDEDVTVVDSAGRLVCQARQLALAPLPSLP
jgi:Thioesterase-like superfamily